MYIVSRKHDHTTLASFLHREDAEKFSAAHPGTKVTSASTQDKLEVLYFTMTRTAKKATAEVYVVRSGLLRHLTTVKFVPGATAGVHREICEAMAYDTKTEVVEIKPEM